MKALIHVAGLGRPGQDQECARCGQSLTHVEYGERGFQRGAEVVEDFRHVGPDQVDSSVVHHASFTVRELFEGEAVPCTVYMVEEER